jgi:hypothetical protein
LGTGDSCEKFDRKRIKRWRQLIQGLTLTLIPYPVYFNRLQRGLYSVDRFMGFYKQ